MALDLGQLVARITADDSAFRRTIRGVHRSLQQVGRAAAFMALAGAASSLAAAVAPAAAGIASLGISLGAAIAPATGLAVALPAIAASAVVALQALKLAFTGVGDAIGKAVSGDLDKFEEELEKLSPAARAVTRELGTALLGLRTTVQDAFFKPLVKESQGLGRLLRGPIQSGMSGVSGSLGGLTARVAVFVRQADSLRFLNNLFGQTRKAIDNASGGVLPLLTGLRDIANLGLGQMPRLGSAIGRMATSMGEWLQKIVASGQAARWFERAVATVTTLGRIFRNVGSTIASVFRAGSIGSRDMLGSIERLTARMAEWAKSARGQSRMAAMFARGRMAADKLGQVVKNLGITLANVFKQAGAGSGDLLGSLVILSQKLATWSGSAEGQQQLASLFSLLNQTAGQLAVVLPILGGALTTIATIIGAMPPGMQGMVTQFLAWSIVLGLITSKIGPLLTGIGLLGKGLFKLGQAVNDPSSRLRRFASQAGSAFSSVGRGAGRAAAAVGRGAAQAASAAGRLAAAGARAAVTAAAAAGRAALSFLAAAGRMAVSAAMTAARVVASGALMAGQMAVQAARVVAGWALMGLQSMIHAARMAAAWLIAMGPVGWIVAAAIAAVALIIANWDKVAKFFTKTLPKWIKQGATWLMNTIKWLAKVGFLGPVGLIIAHWDKIKNFFTKTLPDTVSSGAKKVASFVGSLPGRIKSALGNMGSLLVNAGKDLLRGLWNGIVSMASWLQRSLVNLVRRIVPGPVARILGIASPSKVFAGFGANLAEGLALGMNRNQGLVEAAAGALAGAASAGGSAGAVARPAPVGAAAAQGGALRIDNRLLVDSRGAGLDRVIVELIRRAVSTQGGGKASYLGIRTVG
ncbi:hypothetical protein [Actinomadura sp. 21ATH]|uniref:hypothetical protein n=1 Tax=Actinomadura sp. 21ATH TaxID=1735444 RepID=UPI0035BFCC6B